MDRLRKQVLSLQREAKGNEDCFQRRNEVRLRRRDEDCLHQRIPSPALSHPWREESSMGEHQRNHDRRQPLPHRERTTSLPWRCRREESLLHRERIRIPPPLRLAFRDLGEPPTPQTLGNNDMSRALQQISRSPFSEEIESIDLPQRFTKPTFTIYDGKTMWSTSAIIIKVWQSTLRMRP